MLCHPLRAAAGNAGELELAFRSSSTSSASTITVPSDVVAGDLLVLYDTPVNLSGFPTSVVPTKFSTILNSTSGNARRTVCSYKIAEGTDAGTSITGMNGTNANSKILLAFSTNGATAAAAYDIAFQSTDGDPTAQVVNASGQTTPLVVLAFMRQATATGQSFSPTEDGTVTDLTSKGYYKIYNSSPADVTVDCGDGGTQNNLMSFYIQLKENYTQTSSYNGYVIYETGTAATSHTITSVPIGTAASDRVVAVYLATGVDTTTNITGVTINGVTATKAVDYGTSASRVAAIWYANVTSGTDVNVVVTLGASSKYNGVVASVSMYGLFNTAPNTTGFSFNNATSVTPSRSVDVGFPEGGIVFAGYSAGGENSGTTHSWTNMTEQFDAQSSSGAEGYTAAYDASVTGGTTTVTATGTDTTVNRPGLVVAAWI